MIGRIEIGRDVLEIAAQIGIDETREIARRVDNERVAVARFQRSRGDAELFQSGVSRGRLLLPHDDLIIRPHPLGWCRDEARDFVVLAVHGIAVLLR
jgi:hypothetical protein